MISLLPGKILRLLEFVGFTGNKVCEFPKIVCSELENLFSLCL